MYSKERTCITITTSATPERGYADRAKEIDRRGFDARRNPPVSRHRVRRGGGPLHPAAPVPRRHPAGRKADGAPGHSPGSAVGARGAPGGHTPGQSSPGGRARTRRDRDRPGGRPFREDRRGGAPVRGRPRVDDPGHPARRTVILPRGGAGRHRALRPRVAGRSLARSGTIVVHPRLPRGHAVRHERRDHGARPPGHREIPREGSADHPRGRGRRRRPGAHHPRRPSPDPSSRRRRAERPPGSGRRWRSP